jgi:hypothetical protein
MFRGTAEEFTASSIKRTVRGAFSALAVMQPLAPRLRHTQLRTAMASITALLVVLTLTGEPVANALCLTWCDSSSETQNCDGAIAQTTATEITIARPACDTVVTIAPFVREEGRDGGRVAVITTAPAPVAPLETARVHVVPGRGGTTDGRPLPILILRV